MIEKIPKKLLRSMAEFCRRRLSFVDMTIKEYETFLKWFHSDGRLSVIYDELNNVYALLLFRFLNNSKEYVNDYFHSENGSIVFIDLWVDENRDHGTLLLNSLKRRSKEKTKFSFSRFDEEGKIHEFSFEKINRFIKKNQVLN